MLELDQPQNHCLRILPWNLTVFYPAVLLHHIQVMPASTKLFNWSPCQTIPRELFHHRRLHHHEWCRPRLPLQSPVSTCPSSAVSAIVLSHWSSPGAQSDPYSGLPASHPLASQAMLGRGVPARLEGCHSHTGQQVYSLFHVQLNPSDIA